MDEEQVEAGVESPDQAEVDKAKAGGWTPLEGWRGDPAKWVDAAEFNRRGEMVLPIVKKENQKLSSQLTATQQALAELKAMTERQEATIKNLITHGAEQVKQQVEAKLKELRSQKREAIREGNHDLAADLEEEIDETRDKLNAPTPSAPPPPPVPKGAPPPEPWAVEWAEENDDWFQKDKAKTGMFLAICEEVYAGGLRGRAVLDKARERMEKILNPKSMASKAEGDNGRSQGGGGGHKAANGDYDSLPADAKAACDRQATKFVSDKPGSAFKTKAEYQKYYAETFNATKSK